jgi:hypothetical protein
MGAGEVIPVLISKRDVRVQSRFTKRYLQYSAAAISPQKPITKPLKMPHFSNHSPTEQFNQPAPLKFQIFQSMLVAIAPQDGYDASVTI